MAAWVHSRFDLALDDVTGEARPRRAQLLALSAREFDQIARMPANTKCALGVARLTGLLCSYVGAISAREASRSKMAPSHANGTCTGGVASTASATSFKVAPTTRRSTARHAVIISSSITRRRWQTGSEALR